MKTILIYILTFLPIVTFGQRSNTVFSTGSNGLLQWTYQDFIKNNVVRVQAFQFELKKNGKVKKDSTKLFDQDIISDSNLIKGINCNLNIQSHGPNFLTWYKFKDYYDQKGNLIKQIDQPIGIVKTKEFGSTNWEIIINETTYQFDQRDLLTKKVYNRIEHSYSVSKYTKDTFHLHTISRPKIDEYIYNSKNQKSKWYHTVDSTRYLKTKSYDPKNDSNAVRCSYCHPRYLNVEWIYDGKDNLTEWISYTDENLIHTKRNYFYDDENRLIKQIDSTGWYLQEYSEDQPSLQSIKTMEYNNGGLRKTIEMKGNRIYISEFDEMGNLVENCSLTDGKMENCTKYTYVYQNGLINEIHTLPNQKTTIKYNDDGLLLEKKEYLNNKLSSLIKYYYEKENKAHNTR